MAIAHTHILHHTHGAGHCKISVIFPLFSQVIRQLPRSLLFSSLPTLLCHQLLCNNIGLNVKKDGYGNDAMNVCSSWNCSNDRTFCSLKRVAICFSVQFERITGLASFTPFIWLSALWLFSS